MYAGASLDFNEFHYDDDVAKKAGHKGIIIHGALKSAWLAKLLSPLSILDLALTVSA